MKSASSKRPSRGLPKIAPSKLADSRLAEAGWAIVTPVALWCERHPRLRILAAAAVFLMVVVGVVMFGIFLHFDRIAGKYDVGQIAVMPAESTVYDVRGELIGYLGGDGRTIVPLDQVSVYFQNALIAREDKRFFRHNGVDTIGAVRAGLRNTKDGEVVQGASTLTMQLARNTFGMDEKSFRRKIVEMALARRVEHEFTKEEILELYVNRIFFGSGLNGIEQAAQGYFGKSAMALTLPEAAMIAGIIRAPNRFSPYRHYEAALDEMRDTLVRMEDERMISKAEAELAKSARPEVKPQSHAWTVIRGNRPGRIAENSFALDAIKQKLDLILSDDQKDEGGMDIYSSFDMTLQRAAEQTVARRLNQIESSPDFTHPTYSAFVAKYSDADEIPAPDYLQAAVSVIDNGSGAIRVLVGGRNFDHSEFNRATQAKRQVGSILKPLVYATAFETGIFPGTFIDDGPILQHEIRWDTSGWDPQNSDGKSLGLQPVSVGLVRSRNTMSVRIGERAGFDAVATMMDHAGIVDKTELPRSPQIYIGNLGASLNSVVSAYSVFANEGWRHEPYLIERIEKSTGEVVFDRTESPGYRVLSPGSTWLTSNIMQSTLEPGGTGELVREMGFKVPAGGKTGTTNDFCDAWFLGYTNKLTAGVWVGMDRPETIINGGYGGKLALPIWTEIMQAAAEKGYVFDVLPESDEIIETDLCRYSGHLADDACRRLGCAYHENVPHAMLPRQICNAHERGNGSSDLTVGDEPGFMDKLKGILNP